MAKLFQKFDFSDLEKNPFLVVSVVMIPIMILVIYWNDFSILANEALYNESMTHIILVPVLISYIIYRKKDSLRASFEFEKLQRQNNSLLTEIFGIVFCLFALLLYWYGSSTFYPLEIHLLSLPIFIIGVILVLFSLRTVFVLLFPVLFLLFLIPLPSEIMYSAGGIIGNFDTLASFTLLQTFGLPVALDSTYGPSTIRVDTPSDAPMLFSVDLPCSGIYSLIAFVTFATFLTYITYGSVIKKAGIFIAGFVVMQLLNIVRLSSIIAVGYWFGEEIAMTIVHVTAGWILIFVGILLILLISEKLLHLQLFRATSEALSCSNCNSGLNKQEPFCSYCGKFLKNISVPTKITGRFLAKLCGLCILFLLIALSMQSSVFAFAQGLTFANSDLTECSDVFPAVDGYRFMYLYRDVDYEDLARQDASLMYAYIPLNGSTPTVYVDIGVSSSISNLHNWEVCYVTYQTAQGRAPSVSVVDSRDVQLMENPSIIARYFVFESPNDYTQVTLYWYETALFNTGATIEKKFVRISLIILAPNSTEYLSHEEVLLNFALPISEYWEPLKSQSLFSLGVPLQQGLLVVLTIFIVLVGTAQYARAAKTKSDNLKIFERFVPPPEQVLYETIKNLNDGLGATTKEIADALGKSGVNFEINELFHKLNHLQENKLLKLSLVTLNGNPKVVWKP